MAIAYGPTLWVSPPAFVVRNALRPAWL